MERIESVLLRKVSSPLLLAMKIIIGVMKREAKTLFLDAKILFYGT